MNVELIGHINTINNQRISIDDFDNINYRCFGFAFNKKFNEYEKLYDELQNYKPLYKLVLE
jgi:hypothetical protein